MPIFVFGAGGHAKVVVSTLRAAGWNVEGLLDDDPQKRGGHVLGVPVVGTIAEARRLPPGQGVLAVGDNRVRAKLASSLVGWEWITVIHPRAYVDASATLGPGTVVFAGAVVQPEARIGAHTIVNTGATVDHDCIVGDFVHLAPGVHLGGDVSVGEGTLVGVGAIAIPGRRIGEWSIVGAGGVVVRDVPARSVVIGIPARVVKKLPAE